MFLSMLLEDYFIHAIKNTFEMIKKLIFKQ